ncbi:hypothetical protein APUTEX25_005489, partial [Auxenochlorella protothecoides]
FWAAGAPGGGAAGTQAGGPMFVGPAGGTYLPLAPGSFPQHVFGTPGVDLGGGGGSALDLAPPPGLGPYGYVGMPLAPGPGQQAAFAPQHGAAQGLPADLPLLHMDAPYPLYTGGFGYPGMAGGAMGPGGVGPLPPAPMRRPLPITTPEGEPAQVPQPGSRQAGRRYSTSTHV